MQTDKKDNKKKWPGLPVKYLILSTNDFTDQLSLVYECVTCQSNNAQI